MNFLLTDVASSSESPEALQHHCSTLASLSSKLTVLNMRFRRSQKTHARRAVCHGTSLPSCLRQGSNMSYGWSEGSHRSRRECSDFSSSYSSAVAVPDMTFLKLKPPPGLSAERRCSCLMFVVFLCPGRLRFQTLLRFVLLLQQTCRRLRSSTERGKSGLRFFDIFCVALGKAPIEQLMVVVQPGRQLRSNFPVLAAF